MPASAGTRSPHWTAPARSFPVKEAHVAVNRPTSASTLGGDSCEDGCSIADNLGDESRRSVVTSRHGNK